MMEEQKFMMDKQYWLAEAVCDNDLTVEQLLYRIFHSESWKQWAMAGQW